MGNTACTGPQRLYKGAIYLYLYNILHVSRLRKELLSILTLILLTWRIWRAPNNASKWQMGFNSAFRGLKLG